MSPQTLELEADRAAAEGDYAKARSLLEQAVQGPDAGQASWMKLSAMRRVAGDLRGALEAVDHSLAMAPLDFSALLSRAMILEALGDPTAAQEYGNALANAPPESELPPQLRPRVAHGRALWEVHQLGLEQHLRDRLPPHLSVAERARTERLISNSSRRTRHFHQEPSNFHYPGMPETEFHDPALFSGIAELEQQTDAIRAEFDQLIAAEAAEMVPYIQYPERVPLGQWKELNRNPKWTAIHLLRNGERVEANARHCPRTLEAVDRLPQPLVKGASPNAMFSLLAPRTRIPPHTGVANTRLVCHLPLIVPKGCGFRCGETRVEWRVGEAFVFDDTIEHEAWNDSDELRVVLIVDLWPPALGAAEREAVSAIIGASGVRFGEG